MRRKAAEDFARRFECGGLADVPKDSAAEGQSHPDVDVICQLCFSGENEGSETARKMFPCKSCGKKYHTSCLKTWSQDRDLFHWCSWTCPSCRTCEICCKTGEPNKFKFCKRCDVAVHCYCMQPPHKKISSGPYLCSKHTNCHSCGSKVPGNGLSLRWFLGYTLCDACGRLFIKGNYCPVCLKVYRDSESTPMVCCDICQRWVHCKCDGISDEIYLQFQIDGNLPYTCATCRGDCYQVKDLEDAIRELWRRRDEADRDLIASLREASSLPTQEEFFAIWPFSDDDVDSQLGYTKLSSKSAADFRPKKTKEYVKKSSSKKHVKQKESQLHKDITTEAIFEDPISASINGNLSPTVRMCSVNEQGGLPDKFMDEVAVNSRDRKPSIVRFISKINENGTNTSEDVGKAISKRQTSKGTKLVIHLGGRNKTIATPPGPDSYQREQEFMLNGSEAVSQRMIGIIKLGKGKSQVSGLNVESDRTTGLSSPEINDGSAAAVGKNASKVKKVSFHKLTKLQPDTSGELFKSDKQALPSSDALAKDSILPLRLKVKTPLLGSWPLLGEEERRVAKGKRSKRKRPSYLVEKAKQQKEKEVMELNEKLLFNELMDDTWVLKKLNRDAIGKRVEVHQPSDNSWHEGVVGDINVETSMLSVALDGGRVETFELGKQGIRFVLQKRRD